MTLRIVLNPELPQTSAFERALTTSPMRGIYGVQAKPLLRKLEELSGLRRGDENYLHGVIRGVLIGGISGNPKTGAQVLDTALTAARRRNLYNYPG